MSKNTRIRIITLYPEDIIFDIHEFEPCWRKNGLSTNLCKCVKLALEIVPEGGKITIEERKY